MHEKHGWALKMAGLFIQLRSNAESVNRMTLELPPGLLHLAHHTFRQRWRC